MLLPGSQCYFLFATEEEDTVIMIYIELGPCDRRFAVAREIAAQI